MDKKIDFLKIGKATDLTGRDRKIYRILEIFPGFFSIATLVVLTVLSYFKPVWVAYFIIAFDVYWLLLVIYMAIFLITAYCRLKRGMRTNWQEKCAALARGENNFKDISQKKSTSIFKLLSNRYLKTGYPRLLEEVKK